MSGSEHDTRRLLELLGDRATQGLNPAETRELEGLLVRVPDADRLEAEYERIEAGLVSSAGAEPLDTDLRAHLLAQGVAMVGSGVTGVDRAASITDEPPGPVRLDSARARGANADARPARGVLGGLGWLAAAAALALAAIAWWPSPSASDAAPSLADQRGALERDAGDAVAIAMDATDDPSASGVVADIVWSDSRQQGFLRVRGLAANDPREFQYQIWIMDGARVDEHPVSAGVFDLADADYDPVTRQAIIRLAPALPIGQARAFALTIEPPGGVVVFRGERTVLRASIG